MKPAAEKAGFTPKRSDIGGEPGSITHDIIQDLMNSEVVIADMSESNPNVFFELGIRHVLRKSGTVHVVDQKHDIPFDVKGYRAVEYSTDLADIPTAIDLIAEAIRKRIEQPGKSDNPVHDALPSLPIDIRTLGEEPLRRQLLAAQEQVSELITIKNQLQAKLNVFSPQPQPETLTDDDILGILDEADRIMAVSGESILLQLIRAVEENGSPGFVKVLRNVITSPYLSENDLTEIANMCRRYGLQEHRRAVLEIAHQRYKAEVDIMLALAASYDDSPNPDHKLKGQRLIEEFLGIEHSDKGPVMVGSPKPQSRNAIMVLYNFYFDANQSQWVLSLSESAEKILGSSSSLVRNKARALAQLGRVVEAESEFKRAIQLDPGDDTAHAFYAAFLDDQSRYEEAYQERELAIVSDPADGTRFYNLGVQILNDGHVRTQAGTIGRIGPQADRIKAALPLFIKSLDDRRRNLKQSVITVLVRADAIREAQEISEDRLPKGDLNYIPLRYVEALINANGWSSDGSTPTNNNHNDE